MKNHKIWKIQNLENSNEKIDNFLKIAKFEKFEILRKILKFRKLQNLENLKNLEFGKFRQKKTNLIIIKNLYSWFYINQKLQNLENWMKYLRRFFIIYDIFY